MRQSLETLSSAIMSWFRFFMKRFGLMILTSFSEVVLDDIGDTSRMTRTRIGYGRSPPELRGKRLKQTPK